MLRRTALKAGLIGATGLTLPTFLRLQAASRQPRKETAVILMWLDGGPSHLESYDPKPDAPVEYRGPYGTLPTRLPGVRFSDRCPEQARRADQLCVLRSVHHGTGDHFAGGHVMLTGYFGATGTNTAPRFPGVGAYTSKLRGANAPELPAFVGLPAAQTIYLFPGYQGASYLGGTYNPFDVDNSAKYLGWNDTRRIGRPKAMDALTERATGQSQPRRTLLAYIDTLRRDLDRSGQAAELDRFQQQALDLMTSSRAREAFDIEKEDPRAADRYGTGPWGRYTLMARRLVEAGVTFVTVDMPHWDDHSNIEKAHDGKLRAVDRAVGALVDDLRDRGLFDRVLLVVMGEFGRTPKINTGQPGIPIPGRDHWGGVFSVVMAGGGLKGGQVIGASNTRGEIPKERPLTPQDVLATIYRVLGIDTTLTFNDHSGRPHPILNSGQPISEIL